MQDRRLAGTMAPLPDGGVRPPVARALPAPLGDDWLCWDPERIHCYPEDGPEPGPSLEAETGEPPARRRWPALEVLGLLISGFAIGLIAGAVMVTVVLVVS